MATQAAFDSDFDMSAYINESHFANEFIDSDEGSPLPDLYASHAASPRPHRPHSSGADSFHAMRDVPQNCGSPSEALGFVSNSSQSVDAPNGSTFDSASSKRTSTTGLTQMTAADPPTGPSINGKTGWGMMGDGFYGSAGNVFSSADQGFEFLNGAAGTQSHLHSPMDTGSPFGSALTSLSPEAAMASPPAREDAFSVSSLVTCAACRHANQCQGFYLRISRYADGWSAWRIVGFAPVAAGCVREVYLRRSAGTRSWLCGRG